MSKEVIHSDGKGSYWPRQDLLLLIRYLTLLGTAYLSVLAGYPLSHMDTDIPLIWILLPVNIDRIEDISLLHQLQLYAFVPHIRP